jgi:hypothetical protein
MSATRFIALHCGEEAQALLEKHPNAFLLLTQIAMRAKWKDCPITGLKTGQAFIGDWRKAGLHSQMAYRHAKQCLTECQLATFQGTNKGTIAALVNARVFSVSPQTGTSKTTTQQQPRNEPTTTNHTDTQSTQTPFALNGASSTSPLKISWSLESGFSGITEKDRAEWKAAFPAVNLDQQLAAASLWLKNNPAKRKKLVGKFITGWLSRKQERGGDIPSNPAPAGTIITGGRAFKS